MILIADSSARIALASCHSLSLLENFDSQLSFIQHLFTSQNLANSFLNSRTDGVKFKITFSGTCQASGLTGYLESSGQTVLTSQYSLR